MILQTSDQIREEGIIEEAIDSDGQKFCVECKHLLGVRYKDDTDKWRCVHPNNLKENREELDLVLGIKKYIRIYKETSLYFLRGEDINHCGKKGLWFEKYEEHKFPPRIGGQAGTELEVFDEAALKNNREKAELRIANMKAKKLSKDDLSNL